VGPQTFLSVLMLSVFGFVSVVVWAGARRREREAFYRAEAMKKVAESAGGGGAAVLDILREQERLERRRRQEAQKLGGLITIGVGIGMMIFLKPVVRHDPVYLIGTIPLLVGLAMLAYAYFIAAHD
jgi:hypothetical protein